VWLLAGTKDQAILAASLGFGVTLFLAAMWWWRTPHESESRSTARGAQTRFWRHR
jgi:hypothetical protein